MDEMPFGLARKETFAALSATDLNSLGKEASLMYLGQGLSLNDAVIKLAQQHPSISQHQVKRVVEFANTETFQKMFEKQADDKNIEFPVADAGTVLKNLDLAAHGSETSVSPSEYSHAPVKLAHASAEADLAIASMFGYDLTPKGVVNQIEQEKVASAVSSTDRVLMAKEGMGPMMGGQAGAPGTGGPLMAGPAPQANGTTPEQQHHDQMLNMTRSVELEKKKQELASIQQKTLEMMQGPPPGQPGEGAGVEPPPEVAAAMQGPPEGGAMGGPAAGAPPPAAGPAPGAEGPIPEKMGSALTKQAMDYAKAHRPNSDLVLRDLADATSLEQIKQAAPADPYPEHNQYRELLTMRSDLHKLAEESIHAKDQNEYMLKEATDHWGHTVCQHLLGGGSFGEVAHAVAHVDDSQDGIKLATESLMPYIEHHNIDPAQLQAQLIHYDMSKFASRRQVNPQNPIVQSYATLKKLADGQDVLNTCAHDLNAQLVEVDQVVGKVLTDAHQVQ